MSESVGMPNGLQGVLRHPSAHLLTAQLSAVLAYPFLDTSRAGSAVLGVISMVAVGLALWVVLTGALLHAPFYLYVFYGRSATSSTTTA
ncbi:MAG: hypothetical protein ABIR34_09695 [Marmoricola sp.]